jgi:hypothetical protein
MPLEGNYWETATPAPDAAEGGVDDMCVTKNPASDDID